LANRISALARALGVNVRCSCCDSGLNGSRFVEMERLMSRLNNFLSVVVLTCFAAGASLAQRQTQAQQEPKPAETSTMKMEDVSKWTQKQWNAAKAKWTEKRAQWNDCQTQAKVKNLSGRKSWQFLYDCMTK
jgi:hypothetical protein